MSEYQLSYTASEIDKKLKNMGNFISYAEAQDLTYEQGQQARENILQYKYNWTPVTRGALVYNVCDYHAAKGVYTHNIDCELASTLTSANDSSCSSLGYYASLLYVLISQGATDEAVTEFFQKAIPECEVMKNGGALNGSGMYIAIRDITFTNGTYFVRSDYDNPKFRVLFEFGNGGNFTHDVKIELGNSLLGFAYWNNDTQTLYRNNIGRDYIDTTLTRQNCYADAKVVGDRFAELEERIVALEASLESVNAE